MAVTESGLIVPDHAMTAMEPQSEPELVTLRVENWQDDDVRKLKRGLQILQENNLRLQQLCQACLEAGRDARLFPTAHPQTGELVFACQCTLRVMSGWDAPAGLPMFKQIGGSTGAEAAPADQDQAEKVKLESEGVAL